MMDKDTRMGTDGQGSIIAVGFGCAVGMWTVGYVSRVPPVVVPPAVVLCLLLACLLAAGFVLGRWTPGNWRAALGAGLVTGLLNLLVLGSLLVADESNALVPGRLVWIPGSILSTVIPVLAGWSLGRRGVSSWRGDAGWWRSGLAAVTVLATVLVVAAGGLVTSTGSGLAVPDWPNSYGSNMFLYPLSRMTGGIYYEHAHRLYGALVGLATVALAISICRRDSRGWFRMLSILAVVMVIGQGLMGGLRVTGTFTLAEQPIIDDGATLRFAVAHGIFGQVFCATTALIWACSTRSYRDPPPQVEGLAAPERALGTTLVVLALAQLVLGAFFRHGTGEELSLPVSGMAHVLLSIVVGGLAVVVGVRAWGRHGGTHPMLRRFGMLLIVVVSLQMLLGIAALVAVLSRSDGPRAAEVLLATAHQVNGAIFLAICVLVMAWMRRLLPGDRHCLPGPA